MFSKKHRLSKDKEVKRTIVRGRSFFNRFFVVKYFSVPGASGAARFTVVVSTKVSKKAVLRNRIKRLVREFVKRKIHSFLPGDYVVTVKPGVLSASEEQWILELESLFVSKRLFL